jgi:hypothetical protein
VVRRFNDPVEVRVRGESGGGRRGGGDAASTPPPASPTRGQSAGDRLASRSSLTDVQSADLLEVGAGAGDPAQPEAFIWRGRLYVVREVLATWRERRAWWREALDADDAQVRPGETLAAAARERQVWRVEASPGWSFAPGVYDLVHDESGSDPRPRSRGSSQSRPDSGWSLVRVAD